MSEKRVLMSESERLDRRAQARAKLKADFDKDTVVDLLCNRIDELEEAIRLALRMIEGPEKVKPALVAAVLMSALKEEE